MSGMMSARADVGAETGTIRTLAETARLDGERLRRQYATIFRPDLRSRALTLGTLAAVFGLFFYGLVVLDFSFERIFGGLGQLVWIIGLMMPPSFDTLFKLQQYLNAFGETLAIAFLGTLMAALIAFPLSILAARNTTIHTVVRFLTRRLSDTVRAIDTLIWALIWVGVVGLGPFAGILAIMCSDVGSFIKLFSEAIEGADVKPTEGVLSTGGSPLHATRFAVIPQVLPVIAAQVLYFFESNTRSSTIIGIVGAGGIGLFLAEEIRTNEWQRVSFLILLILVAVAIIDFISARLRRSIIGAQRRP